VTLPNSNPDNNQENSKNGKKCSKRDHISQEFKIVNISSLEIVWGSICFLVIGNIGFNCAGLVFLVGYFFRGIKSWGSVISSENSISRISRVPRSSVSGTIARKGKGEGKKLIDITNIRFIT
jgi:hypothetical protein